MNVKLIAAIASGSLLAAGSGYLASVAIGQEVPADARTVTVNVGTGEQGPPGPQGEPGVQGPPGEPGGLTCPTGYTMGVLRINHPGGQTDIWTCLAG